jgi:hypothetical protein
LGGIVHGGNGTNRTDVNRYFMAQYLGMVEASDADAAILKATEKLKVPPQQRKRLIAVRYT